MGIGNILFFFCFVLLAGTSVPFQTFQLALRLCLVHVHSTLYTTVTPFNLNIRLLDHFISAKSNLYFYFLFAPPCTSSHMQKFANKYTITLFTCHTSSRFPVPVFGLMAGHFVINLRLQCIGKNIEHMFRRNDRGYGTYLYTWQKFTSKWTVAGFTCFLCNIFDKWHVYARPRGTCVWEWCVCVLCVWCVYEYSTGKYIHITGLLLCYVCIYEHSQSSVRLCIEIGMYTNAHII